MIDTTEPLAAALADFGVDALVNYGPQTLRVLFDLDTSARFAGETIDRSGPSAVALAAAVEAAGIVAGNQGDELTVGDAAYTVLAIDPDGQGGAVLSLEAVV